MLRAGLAKELRASLEGEIRPQLEREVRLRLEGEIRAQLEREVRAALEKDAAVERERAQARTKDLERQVRELEGIVHKRQLQHQASGDLPGSSPARERQLQERVDQLQRQLDDRRAAQGQLQEAALHREEQLQQLQRQLDERRAAERHLQEQLKSADEQLQERHAGVSKVQAHLQTVKVSAVCLPCRVEATGLGAVRVGERWRRAGWFFPSHL